MYSTLLLLAYISLITGGFAQSACTGPQYNTIPGFPASNSGCYPLGYYQTSDLGQTSPTDAQSRCQSQCTNMGSSCGSVVAQVNKAADSNLYPSGTCFFYAPGQTPTGPRQCANTAYLLEGYMKDNTLACFSSSLSSASQFCSSYLNIPISTVMVTSTPPVMTVTTTATARPTISALLTNTVTPTVTVSTTQTTMITVATNTATQTATTLSTITSTATATATVTAAMKKRALAAVAAPACVTPGTPATRLSAACSCLSVKTSTTTKTTTLSQSTATVTSTSSVPVTMTLTGTATASAVTSTTTYTSTISVTATTTITTTSTAVATTTVTTTTTTTTTPPPAAPSTYCSNAQYNQCGNNCYCNIDSDGHTLVCSAEQDCPNGASAANPACHIDADCVALLGGGYACVYDVMNFCSGGYACAKAGCMS